MLEQGVYSAADASPQIPVFVIIKNKILSVFTKLTNLYVLSYNHAGATSRHISNEF